MPRNVGLGIVVVLLAAMLAGCGASGGATRSDAARRDESPTPRPTTRRSAAETNVELGQGYMAQGKLDIAMEKLKRALALDPKYPSAHTVIAVLYERIGDAENAEYHYRRATELAPKSGDAANNLGTFLCRRSKFPEADQYFERALADPFYNTPAVALANRGICAVGSENIVLAEDSFGRALKLSPTLASALVGMADVQFRKKEYLRARAFLQRFEAAAPASPDALALGLKIERALGNSRAVNEYKKRLLTEFPDSDAARGLEG